MECRILSMKRDYILSSTVIFKRRYERVRIRGITWIIRSEFLQRRCGVDSNSFKGLPMARRLKFVASTKNNYAPRWIGNSLLKQRVGANRGNLLEALDDSSPSTAMADYTCSIMLSPRKRRNPGILAEVVLANFTPVFPSWFGGTLLARSVSRED